MSTLRSTTWYGQTNSSVVCSGNNGVANAIQAGGSTIPANAIIKEIDYVVDCKTTSSMGNYWIVDFIQITDVTGTKIIVLDDGSSGGIQDSSNTHSFSGTKVLSMEEQQLAIEFFAGKSSISLYTPSIRIRKRMSSSSGSYMTVLYEGLQLIIKYELPSEDATIGYVHNSQIVHCIPYYCDGSKWIQCTPYYCQNGEYKPISTQ